MMLGEIRPIREFPRRSPSNERQNEMPGQVSSRKNMKDEEIRLFPHFSYLHQPRSKIHPITNLQPPHLQKLEANNPRPRHGQLLYLPKLEANHPQLYHGRLTGLCQMEKKR
jgi:hypothetical protein